MDRPGARTVIEAEPGGDHRPPVAALREIAVIAQDLGHQGVEEARRGPLADRPRRPGRKAEAGEGGDHQVERVGRGCAMARGKGELVDDVPEFEVTPRPAVAEDQRPPAAGLADHVDEVQVEVLDAGGELVEPVELGHCGAPVVGASPVRAQAPQKGAVAAIGPAVGRRGRDRPGIGPDRLQHARHVGLAPVHLERFDLGHGVLRSGGRRWPVRLGLVKRRRSPGPACRAPRTGPRSPCAHRRGRAGRRRVRA